MSVTGFLVDNTVQKYNYESLENYNTPDFSTSSTYQVGDYVMYQGKLYKCVTAITTSGEWDSTKWNLAILSDDVADLNSTIDTFFVKENVVFNSGYYFNYVQGGLTSSSSYSYVVYDVSACNGGKIKGTTSVVPNGAIGLGFFAKDGMYLGGEGSTNTGSYVYNFDVTVPDGAEKVYISCRDVAQSSFIINLPNDVILKNLREFTNEGITIEKLQKANNNVYIPVLRNGSIGNSSNANSVTNDRVIAINQYTDYISFDFIGNTTDIDEFAVTYCLFSGAEDDEKTTTAFSDSTITKIQVNTNADERISKPHCIINLSSYRNYDHISFSVWRFSSGTFVPIRVANEQYSMRIEFLYGDAVQETEEDDVLHKLNNARHEVSNSNAPLTILHFSDLHADTEALSRIINDANDYGTKVDEIICTGDMVGNTAGQISSWWNENVLTCIGNHDTASYSSETGYNWTALSMANRDAYYIAPFESNWGITHTSGKSYYYKDYASSKVRMIVMDAMLYTDAGQDATEQTTWLSGLLSSAITNSLHVLIAIHAPHGGATAIDCSFTEYGTTTMPTYTDCNTPQAVIDTVSTAIGNGLKFIGYIVGHMHHDVMWDAENNHKQLMYCVTCANVRNSAQWINADMYRSTKDDAFNLVTIDTTRTLVKIIRGGGANIDDHMRTRQAICFNYSTGEMVGEVL